MNASLQVKEPEVNNLKEKSTAQKVLTVLGSQKGWLFVAPALLLMVLFTFYPIVNSLISAFKNNYDGLTGAYNGWGIENFKYVFMYATDGANFVDCLINTLIFAFISVPVSTLLALFISVALASIKPLQKAYQTVFFLPYLTNSLAMGAVFATFFTIVGTSSNVDTYGIVNNIIMAFGGSPIDFIGDSGVPWANRLVIIVYEIWSGLPFKILILFSALQSVNKQYYDAAKVDGASKNTTLWKITVPLISPMLSYLLITGLMGGLKSYSAILGIYGDKMGPVRNEMNTMVGYIYACIETAANTTNPGAGGGTGKAAAASLILFGIIMVFTAINLYVSKKKVHY